MEKRMVGEVVSFEKALQGFFHRAAETFGLEFREQEASVLGARAFSVDDRSSHNKLGTLYISAADESPLATTFANDAAGPAATMHVSQVFKGQSAQDALLSLGDLFAVLNLGAHALRYLLVQGPPRGLGSGDFSEFPSQLADSGPSQKL
jgi:hypothetical protein